MPSLTEFFKRARGDAPVNRVAKLVKSQKQALAEVNVRLSRIEAMLANQARGAGGGLIERIDTAAWANVAQAGELDFHKRPNWRSRPSFTADVAADWQSLGFGTDDWQDKLIIDVGAGSRLRTLFFRGARIAALEPLADQFIREVEWQDLDKAAEIYPVPVETLVSELVGRGDLIVSINALDHGFEFEAGIGNIRKYAKPDATVFLSFDQHDKPDNMHPLMLNDEFVRKVFGGAGFEVVLSSEHKRYHGGKGPCALNYWLKPV